jgi:hypothetical protein
MKSSMTQSDTQRDAPIAIGESMRRFHMAAENNYNHMKKLIFGMAFLGSFLVQPFAEAAGCYQAVRKCEGTWTAYTCITDYTSSNCSQFYCESCGLEEGG